MRNMIEAVLLYAAAKTSNWSEHFWLSSKDSIMTVSQRLIEQDQKEVFEIWKVQVIRQPLLSWTRDTSEASSTLITCCRAWDGSKLSNMREFYLRNDYAKLPWDVYTNNDDIASWELIWRLQHTTSPLALSKYFSNRDRPPRTKQKIPTTLAVFIWSGSKVS